MISVSSTSFALVFSFASCVTAVASQQDYLRKGKAAKSAKLAKLTSTDVGSNVLLDFTFITPSPTPNPTPSNAEAGVGGMITLDSMSDDLLIDIVTLPTTPATISVDTSKEYVWSGGLCTSNEDCHPKVREHVPGDGFETIGVELCECYANSNVDVLDECQGRDLCAITGCFENSCRGISTYCSESGFCMLDNTIINHSDDSILIEVTPSDENDDLEFYGFDATEMSVPVRDIIVVGCTTDDDCTGSLVCTDESNGNCFFPPCGRCSEMFTEPTSTNNGLI